MAGPSASYVPYHDSAGKTTNPTTADVLADTGVMVAGIYEVRVFLGCSVAATFNIQHRNAANDGGISDPVLIRAAAGQTGEYVLKYGINLNERIRVVPEANITGAGEASVQAIRVA
jgi:hypothetical protein